METPSHDAPVATEPLRATLNTWEVFWGNVFTAVAVLSILAQFFSVGLDGIVGAIVANYVRFRDELLFSAFEAIFPLTVPPVIRDVSILFSLLFAVVVRSYLSLSGNVSQRRLAIFEGFFALAQIVRALLFIVFGGVLAALLGGSLKDHPGALYLGLGATMLLLLFVYRMWTEERLRLGAYAIAANVAACIAWLTILLTINFAQR